MELSNTRVVPAPPAVVWDALNNREVLKACLPGCESLEPAGDGAWQVVMAVRVGPVSARFNGRINLTDIEPPTAYTLHFEGQGAAGFAKGQARVTLAAGAGAQTAMTYVANAQIGGKLAQIGSRLVDGAAAKVADDFFARFVTRLASTGAGSSDPAPGPPQPSTMPGMASRSDADGAGATRLAPPGGSTWIRYAAILAIVIVVIVLFGRGYR